MIEKEIFTRWYQFTVLMVFGLQSFSIGYYQFKKESPFVVNGRLLSYFMLFLTIPGLLYWIVRGYLVHNSLAFGIIPLFLYALIWLLAFTFFGDLVVFNIDEVALKRAIEKVCEKESITFTEGLTTGLLAPGCKTKSRSIVTYYLDTIKSKTPVRYVVVNRRNMASIKILKKKFFQDWPAFASMIAVELRNQPIASGRSYMYSFLIGCALLFLAYLKVNSI